MAPDSHRSLCTHLAPNVIPLNWPTPLPSPPIHTHLPVDALVHLPLPLLAGLSHAPLIGFTLLPDLPPLPHDEIMLSASHALRRKAQSLMMDHWHSLPLPEYYSYPLRLAPHPIIGLWKFIAGCIHQMRARKSYLAAFSSWFNASDSKLCPLCGDEPETFSHAIFRYPAKATARVCHLQGVSSVGPDAPLSSSPFLLLSLAAFIQATSTASPPNMILSFPPSPASMVFLSSPVCPPPVVLCFSCSPCPI